MSSALILTDGRAGNLRQARALAAAMRVEAREVEIRLRAPWTTLAPRLPILAPLALGAADGLARSAPWPDLAIGCGRAAAWATRWLRRRARGATFCVQILDPRITSRHWDLVIAPRHDPIRGDNVLQATGSLNPVDSAWLASARARFTTLADLPQPRLAILLGGPRRGIAFDGALAEALAAAAEARLAAGGSALLCASPRTPPEFAAALRERLAGRLRLAWLGPADGPNPYAGCLAWADRILVTPDSVNMLSEAASCGVPVHTVATAPLPRRIAALHATLRAGGWLHDAEAEAGPPAEPLRETHVIAEQVLQRMQAHFAARRG